jgi:hypothetical protein
MSEKKRPSRSRFYSTSDLKTLSAKAPRWEIQAAEPNLGLITSLCRQRWRTQR